MEIRVHIAVLVVAADPHRANTAAADVITQKAAAGGHSVVARAAVADSEAAIRGKLDVWIADREIDVVIVAADAETQHTSNALKPLVDEPVPGFTDLFRWLAFQEIGASAMTASAEAAKCGKGGAATFVFVLPGVTAAATAAMDRLILPQLDARATGKTLVAQMPRLAALVAPAGATAPADAASSAPADEVITEPTEAVPTAVTGERTEAGPGLHPRLPAVNVVRKELVRKETLAPAVKPPPDERTRVISTSQLERKLQQSNQHDVATKPRIDLAKLLPRVPPGADADFDDAETSDITGVLSPQPFTTRPTPVPKKLPVSVPAVIKREDSGRARQAPRRDEDGRVIIPSKDPGSGVIGRAKISQPPANEPVRAKISQPPANEPAPTVKAPRPTIHDAKTPPIEMLPPALRPKFEEAKTQAQAPKFETKTPAPQKASFEAKTPVPQVSKFVDAKTPTVAPHAPRAVEPIARPKATTPPAAPPAAAPAGPKPPPKWIAAETLETFEPIEDDEDERPTLAPAPRREPERLERPEVSSPSIALDDVEVEIVSRPIPILAAEPPAPVPLAPPPRPLVTTPPPMPVVAPPRPPVTTPPVAVAPLPAPPALAAPPAPPAPTAPPPRKREPTPAPILPKRIEALDDALPLGAADFASLKPRTGRRVAIFLLLAVLAAAGGVAFVRFVIQKPATAPEVARAPAAVDAAVAAPKSIDASVQVAQAPVPVDASPAPEVEQPAPPPPTESHAHGGSSTTRGHHHDHDHADHGHVVAEVPPPPGPPKPPPETPKPPEPPPAEDGCDEISCVEINYAKTCCERYKPHEAGFRPSADSLDKSAVLDGMGTVKPRVIACGEANKDAPGVVTIAVVVNGSGAVTGATVVDAPSPKLGECVAAAVKRAHFAKTVNGGTFNYPFKF